MMTTLTQEQKSFLFATIRDIPHFPKEGIIFKDITTLLNNKEAFALLIDHLAQKYQNGSIDAIAGIESRGFIFGAALAVKLGIGFVPIRKKGKLPSATYAQNYDLEYGTDTIEVHQDAFRTGDRVLLIDDLIATGGTAKAAVALIEKTGAICVEACFVLGLTFLTGIDELEKMTKVYTVLEVA